MKEIALQREYYAKTAAQYDTSHVGPSEPEHDFALMLLGGIAGEHGYESFLDVGAGTGRGMGWLKGRFPAAVVNGIEPVKELREVGYAKGISPLELVDGDATRISYPDNSFECILALGIMHHLPDPRSALTEMVRVSSKAVFISDLNNFGCGGLTQRALARSLRALGLWKSFQFVKNGFKHAKFSEGDGIHYSYSLLDDVPFLHQLDCATHVFTTSRCGSPSPLWGSSHVAVLALKGDRSAG
jgi:ubiquinone/menaquinone biosynthesis C-methylase UbiE